MNSALLGFLGFVLALALIAFGFPVAVAMAVVGVAGFWLLNGWTGAAFILGSSPFEAIFPYSLSVVPLFVMMGVFAARAGLSRSLFNVVNGFFGHIRGGLAVTAVGACALFGAICGSSLATVATMGRVAIPEMKRHGYSNSLSSAAIAAGGTLGVLIPPSILLVIYGILTQTSIGQLFIGAIIPGILGTILYGAAIVVQVRLKPELAPPTPKTEWGARFASLGRVWGVVLLFGLVIGGIYVGLFSPTEAAAVGAVGAFVLALISGELDREALWDAVRETASLTGMIFFILIGALQLLPRDDGAAQRTDQPHPGQRPEPHGRARPDPDFLYRARLLHGFHVDDPADGAFSGACGTNPWLRHGLVWNPDRDRSRDRPDHAAGRDEPLRGPGDHAGPDAENGRERHPAFHHG
jgi:TRAP-type mannitol/chloroaromatic compound transport system permease large subunit